MAVPVRFTRTDPGRVVAVTAGLIAAGATFGALAGATALGIALFVSDGMRAFGELSILIVPGAIGAALGAVCAPVAGWLLLRRVPLGRAFATVTIGTVLGGILGWFLPAMMDPFVQPIVAAGAGFVAAAVALRLATRTR